LPAGCAVKTGLIEDNANGVRLVKAMKANQAPTSPRWRQRSANHEPRPSAPCHRLREAELAESLSGIWTLTEVPPPKETPRWTAPVSAQRRRVETDEREDA
jgi:hypothetical protein